MVRHKTRWLLIQLEYKDDVCCNSGSATSGRGGNINSSSSNNKNNKRKKYDSNYFPSKKDLYIILKNQIQQLFGIDSSSIIVDIQVRFCDPITRLILLRVQRNDCNKVRSAITLLTSIPTTSNSNSSSNTSTTVTNSIRGSEDDAATMPIIASILSIHGCLRTAKLGTMKCIKHMYRTKVLQLQNDTTSTATTNRRGNDDDYDDYGDDTAVSYRNNKKKKQKMTTTSASTTSSTTTYNNNNNNTKERRELLRQLDDVLLSIQTME